MSEITVTVVGATGVTTAITSPDTVNVAAGTAYLATVPSLLVLGGKNVTVTTATGSFTVDAADAPVTSVNGRTGAVTVTRGELGAAALSHTHAASSITDFATEAAKYGPVTSVNGKTGVVSLVPTDISAASSTHTHNYVQSLNSQTGTLNILAGTNVTVTTAAGSITIASAGVTSSGLTAAVTSLNARTGALSLVAGSNITVTTSTSSITIAAAAGAGNAFAMTYLFGG